MEFNSVILSFLLLGSLLTFSGGQQLSFGSQKDVFKHDNFESVPDGWTLTNAAIVSVSSQAPKQTTPPPTTKAPDTVTTTTNSTAGEAESRIVFVRPVQGSGQVSVIAGNNQTKFGTVSIPLKIEAMTTYELHTEAGVRGYDLTAQNYNQSKLPTFEIFIVKVGENTPSILFDFKQHGLEFGKQNEDWVNFRVQATDLAAGNYSLVYEISGSSDPNSQGVLLKKIHLLSSSKPKTNDQIHEEWKNNHTTPVPETTTPKPNPEEETEGASASVIALAILVVILALALGALGWKYYRTNKKLQEYRVSAPSGGRAAPYDNPMYSGAHTPAERMGSTGRGSVTGSNR